MSRNIIYFSLLFVVFILGFFSGQYSNHGSSLAISDNLIFEQLEKLDYTDIQSVLFNHNSSNLVLIDQQGNARTIPTKLLLMNIANVPFKGLENNHLETIGLKNTRPKIQAKGIRAANSNPIQDKQKKAEIAPALPTKMTHQEVNQKILTELPVYLFSKIPSQMSLFYKTSATEVKDTLVVFTDPSCPHCREFHSKYLPRLLKDGYNVRYFPIARVSAIKPDGHYQYNTQVEKRLQWALCLDDRFSQIDLLFKNRARRDPTKPTQCNDSRWNIENNIKLSFHFVKAARGTPAIFSKNGYASNKILANGNQITPGIASFSEQNYQAFVRQLAYFKPNAAKAHLQ